MGLTSHALAKVHRPLGFTFKLGKLLYRISENPKPTPTAEKIFVFVLGMCSGTAAMGYYVIKILVGKRQASIQAREAMDVLKSYDHNGDGEYDATDVAAAVKSSADLVEPAVIRARAGFVFVHDCMIKGQAGDKRVTTHFVLPSGIFDVPRCLKTFYGSSKSKKLHQLLVEQNNGALTEEMEVMEVSPLVEDILHGLQVKLLMDAVDLFIL